MSDCGKLIVISGPSGAGKSTVISKLIKSDKSTVFSVSATTRAKRAGEIEGRDYFFIDKQRFEQMIENNELLEYAKYVDNYYGTPRDAVYDHVCAGHDVIFDIEVQGAMQILKKCPDTILIFLIPSNFSEIEKRLRGRGTDGEEVIKDRIQTAKNEYLMALNYSYIVLNDNPDTAADEIHAIITAERCKLVERKKFISEVCSL